MNFYDCFMFFDEEILLDVRFNILNKYIKKFIITESLYTHKGEKRNLKFDINKFRKFKDKIEYIVVEDIPKDLAQINSSDSFHEKNSKILLNALKRENFQRNMLSKGLVESNDEDLIFISDVDEIPNLENLKEIKKLNFFNQKMYYYKFNLEFESRVWVGTRACKKKHLISPQWLRNIKFKHYPFWRIDTIFSKKKYTNINFVDQGGWHFTNIKTPKEIHYKLSNFLHHLEYEHSGLKESDLEKIIKEKRIYYDHEVDKSVKKWKSAVKLKKVDIKDLPDYIKNNQHKLAKWFD